MNTESPATQNEAILRLLNARLGQWVGMPELSDASTSYNVHSRISELRKQGHEIENRIEHGPGLGNKKSYYRIPIKGQMDLF